MQSESLSQITNSLINQIVLGLQGPQKENFWPRVWIFLRRKCHWTRNNCKSK